MIIWKVESWSWGWVWWNQSRTALFWNNFVTIQYYILPHLLGQGRQGIWLNRKYNESSVFDDSEFEFDFSVIYLKAPNQSSLSVLGHLRTRTEQQTLETADTHGLAEAGEKGGKGALPSSFPSPAANNCPHLRLTFYWRCCCLRQPPAQHWSAVWLLPSTRGCDMSSREKTYVK